MAKQPGKVIARLRLGCFGLLRSPRNDGIFLLRAFRAFPCLFHGGGIVEFACPDQLGLKLVKGLPVSFRQGGHA